MKTEWTSNGWKEITTKVVSVTNAPEKSLMSVEDWLDFNRRHPRIGRHRRACKCCKDRWDIKAGYVHLLFTDKGNMTVCDSCYSRYKHIKPVDNPIDL